MRRVHPNLSATPPHALEVAVVRLAMLRKQAAREAAVVDATLYMTLKVSAREPLVDALAILRQATRPDRVAHRASEAQVRAWLTSRLGQHAPDPRLDASPGDVELLHRAIGDIFVLTKRLNRRPVPGLWEGLTAGLPPQRAAVHLEQVERLEALHPTRNDVARFYVGRGSGVWREHGPGDELTVETFAAEASQRW